MALCNDQLNNLLSFPILLSCSMTIINLIIILALYIFSNDPEEINRIYFYAIYVLIINLFSGYTIKMNQDILNQFESICIQMWDNNRIRPNIRNSKMSIESRLNIESKPSNSYRSKHLQCTQQIMLHEIEQYGRLLQMRLFRMTPLTLSILLSIVLFILSNTIFILQTN